MTLEKTDLTVEQVMAVRDRPLEESYKDHDVGQQILIKQLQAHGFTVEEHGDDARHADKVFYGDGPDLAVYKDEDDDEPCAYIEIKCKTKPRWFGRCNLRHYKEYVNFNNEVDVPVFIYFSLIDRDDNYAHREAFVEVADTDQIAGDVVDVSDDTIVFCAEDIQHINDDGLRAVDGSDVLEVRSQDRVVDYIPEVHGNAVIELNDDEFRSLPHVLHRISE